MKNRMVIFWMLIFSEPFLSGAPNNSQKDSIRQAKNGKEAAESKAKDNWWANDWPNLGRYRKANEQLPLPSDIENRVVFMENSITQGWGEPFLGLFLG